MGKTSIEWTRNDDGSPGRTWNPVVGCDKVSPGCTNCYAESIAERFRGGPGYPNGFEVTLKPHKLDEPLRWRKPTRVFVNSMSDLFHPRVPDAFIARVFAVMAQAERHTFQVLTKRHARMRALLSRREWVESIRDIALEYDPTDSLGTDGRWPLPNVWLGTSVEDQERADVRIPALLATPAAVRFLSCEPLLGPVDLRGALGFTYDDDATGEQIPVPPVDWVIVGGESGPNARPMSVSWVRSLIHQCAIADVSVFVKQLGTSWAVDHGHGPTHGGDASLWPDDVRIREFPRDAAVPA